jgi:DNA (cytosine-5)-methyltransferase 1
MKDLMILSFKNMELLNEFEVSNLLDVPLHRLNTWAKNGKLLPTELNGVKKYDKESLLKFDIAKEVLNSKWNEFIKTKSTLQLNYLRVQVEWL